MNIIRFMMEDGKIILSEMPDKFNMRKMYAHLTKMCNSLGLKQKDVIHSCTEYVSWNLTGDEDQHNKELSLEKELSFKAALTGEKKLDSFYLYRYTQEEGFKLLRSPL